MTIVRFTFKSCWSLPADFKVLGQLLRALIWDMFAVHKRKEDWISDSKAIQEIWKTLEIYLTLYDS